MIHIGIIKWFALVELWGFVHLNIYVVIFDEGLMWVLEQRDVCQTWSSEPDVIWRLFCSLLFIENLNKVVLFRGRQTKPPPPHVN